MREQEAVANNRAFFNNIVPEPRRDGPGLAPVPVPAAIRRNREIKAEKRGFLRRTTTKIIRAVSLTLSGELDSECIICYYPMTLDERIT